MNSAVKKNAAIPAEVGYFSLLGWRGVRIAQDRVSVNPGPVLSAQNLDTAGGGFNLRDETLNMVFQYPRPKRVGSQ